MPNDHVDPISLVGIEDSELNVTAGKSYLLDVKVLRKTQPEYYAMRSAIDFLREQAKLYLDDFFRKARKNGLTVCVIIHGWNSSHVTMGRNIGSLKALKESTQMVFLYINWYTQTKVSLFLGQVNNRFITNTIENAYDIGKLLHEALRMHDEGYSKECDNINKLSVLVLAHSMGSHVAEAFINEHKSINLRGVIYFNPHTDHNLYNLVHVPNLYTNRSNIKGFVLSFNSSRDLVLGSSSYLQRLIRNFFLILLRPFFALSNSYVRPLGLSWENYQDKADKGHRVVVLHMKRKVPYLLDNYWLYSGFGDFLRHSSYYYKTCQDISNSAIELAMTDKPFSISEVQHLVKDEHKLNPKEGPARLYGMEEYVNTEPENDKTRISITNDSAKIHELNSVIDECKKQQ